MINKLTFMQGYSILFVAISLNILSTMLNINNWYSFIDQIRQFGLIEAFQRQNIFSLLFLLVVYPASLALAINIPRWLGWAN